MEPLKGLYARWGDRVHFVDAKLEGTPDEMFVNAGSIRVPVPAEFTGKLTHPILRVGYVRMDAYSPYPVEGLASWKPAPMACPCTAAMDTTSLRRHQVKPSWN